MKMTIDAWDAKRVFQSMDRDYYSLNGLEALLDWYDEVDENIEFDPIGICCDCTEYGDYGAAYSIEDLINDYSSVLDYDEFRAEAEAEGELDDLDEEEVKELYLEALIEELEARTTVLRVCNGNYIVFDY